MGRAALSINDGYITLQEGLFQRKELKRSKMNGRVLSVSALFADGTLEHGVIHLPDEIVIGTTYTDGSDTANGCVRYISEDILEYRIEVNGGQYVAVKLELGDQQTLAHQENGVWVLNEIPDYGEQLAMCQRYQFTNITDDAVNGASIGVAAIGLGTNELYASIQYPVEMRATPVIEKVRIWNWSENNSWQQIAGNHRVFTSKTGTTYVYSDHVFQANKLYGIQVFAQANL